MKKKQILLADDHKIILEGLKNILESEFDLVGMVENGKDLMDEALRLQPDIIVADISMPGLSGIEAVRQIRNHNKEVKIIFLTMHLDVNYAAMAFDAGASGYVLKNSASRELITAIHQVLKGRTYVTSMIAGELMQALKTTSPGEQVQSRQMTPRQEEILQLLANGRSAKEIANLLFISTRTVETHKYNMMKDFNLKTTADLIKLAIKRGLTSI